MKHDDDPRAARRPRVPLDPMNGEPLGYRRYADRVVVYSRFSNRIPYGVSTPAFDPDGPSPAGVGIAAHLFNSDKRRAIAYEP